MTTINQSMSKKQIFEALANAEPAADSITQMCENSDGIASLDTWWFPVLAGMPIGNSDGPRRCASCEEAIEAAKSYRARAKKILSELEQAN